MTQVNIHDAKTRFSKLVARAAEGEEIIIARAGRPVCRLVPLRAKSAPRVPGLFAGQPYSMAEDFDDLPEDMLEAFGARP